MWKFIVASCLLSLALQACGKDKVRQKIILTNDDGWAVAQIRAEFDALQAAGFDVVLSAPADNRSGTGSSTAAPTILSAPCEFDTCPTGAPAVGFNASNPRLNYVHAFPVDAVRFGIQTLAPRFFGSKPDFVVSGSNVGNNLGAGITGSGTVGAASESAIEGIPSIAFSGSSVAQVSYTTLTTDPTANVTIAAFTYTDLILKFIHGFVKQRHTNILPHGVSINVNFPSTVNCPAPSSFEFILTRLIVDANATDVETCGTNHLPDETSTVRSTAGCFVSVTVFNATTKKDVDAATQAFVLHRLHPLLSCLPAA